jgi:hypothetical protein
VEFEPETGCLPDDCRKLEREVVPPGELVIPEGCQEQDRHLPEARSQESQELEAGGIEPMQIFKQDERRADGGQITQKRPRIREKGDLIRHLLKAPSGKPGWAGEPMQSCACLEDIKPGTVRRPIRSLVAGTRDRADSKHLGVSRGTSGQGRLADPGLPAQEHKPAMPLEHLRKLPREVRLFPAPAEERPS